MDSGILNATVRKPFKFLPDIMWAILIDSIDIIPAIINTFLTAFFGVGIAFDLFVDVIQMIFALIIFEDPLFAIVNPDLIIPAPFDVFPSYTAKVLFKTNKKKK